MQLELITLAGVKADESIYEVIIPTTDGEIAVFPGHEPLVTLARPGALSIRRQKGDSDEKLDYVAISGGVVEVSATRTRILVDEADYGDDIIESETQAALDRAIKRREETTDQVELERAHQLVERHAVRLKVAELHRRHHR